MNCPNCQTELGPDYPGAWCWFCGGKLPAAARVERPSKLPPPNKGLCWLMFVVGLVGGPAVALVLLKSPNPVFMVWAIFGGAIMAGFSLARLVSKSAVSLVVNGIGFCLLVAVIYGGVAFVGCVALLKS